MTLTPRQKLAVTAPGNVVIQAGAGSGKTHVLAERILFLLEQGLKPRELCAVTFTEAAASELRSRVEAYLEKKLPENETYWGEVLDDFPEAQISTIHSLCGRIAREHPLESDASFTMQVLDEGAFQNWLDRVFPEMLQDLPRGVLQDLPYSLLSKALRELLSDPLTAELALEYIDNQSPEEHQRMLENRLQAAWNALAEQRNLHLQALKGIQCRDVSDPLHPMYTFLLQALGEESCQTFSQRFFSLPYSKSAGRAPSWSDNGKAKIHDAVRWLQEKFTHLQVREVDLWHHRALQQLQNTYLHTLKKRYALSVRDNVMGFADLEYHARLAMQHPHVQKHYQERWKVLLIDEFQDTSPAQWTILKNLLSDRTLYTVVGDEKQSIYGFRGSDVRLIQALARDTLQGGSVVDLDTSFRTHHSLVEAVNRVFEVLFAKQEHPSSVPMRPLKAARAENPSAQSCVEVHALAGDTITELREAESRLLVLRIQDLLRQGTEIHDRQSGQKRRVQHRDIAVLYRSKTHLDTYLTPFKKAGIPHVVESGSSLFGRQEVQDQITFLQFLSNPLDDLALAALLRGPCFMLSDPELLSLTRNMQQSLWHTLQETPACAGITQLLKSVLQERTDSSPVEVLEALHERTLYPLVLSRLPEAERQLLNVARFKEVLRDLYRQGHTDIFSATAALLKLVDAGAEVPEAVPPSLNAVRFMTIHKSKGLEFPVVFLLDALHTSPNFKDQVLIAHDLGVALRHPDEMVEEPEKYQHLHEELKVRSQLEELRVKYVAFTRAADLLILSMNVTPKQELAYHQIMQALDTTDHEVYPYEAWQIPSLEPIILPPLPAPAESDASGSGSLPFLLPESLPVTSVGVYLKCPRSFEYQHLRGMKPVTLHWGPKTERPRILRGKNIGGLVHTALENHWLTFEDIQSHLEGEHPAVLHEVFRLVSSLEDEAFRDLQGLTFQRERAFRIPYGSMAFEGVIDAFTDTWIIDYKTDSYLDPEHHLPQMALYSHHLQIPKASLVYLRHNTLHTFSAEELQKGLQDIDRMLSGLRSGVLNANPSAFNCRFCPHQTHCPDAVPLDGAQ